MSRLTDLFENRLVDFMRGQGLTLPASNWYIGLLSAAGDPSASNTELSGSGYARQAVPRTLAGWAGTQAAGSTTASTGSSHQTSNNALVDYGTPGGAWGTCRSVGLFDAATGGNCLATAQLTSAVSILSGVPFSIAAGAITWTLGATGGLSDYLANKLIDLIWRGQAYTWPSNTYAALYTSAPGNGDTGAEVAGGSYARAVIASSLAAWSGTQSTSNTVASSGTSGQSRNNNPLTFPAPTATWGALTHGGLRDASTAGNLLFWAALGTPGTVTAGASAPAYAAGALLRTLA